MLVRTRSCPDRERRGVTHRGSPMAKRSETAAPAEAFTLKQVKDALAKVAAHSQCSKKMADTIAMNSGGSNNWDTIRPKKFGRVMRKCESVIKEANGKQADIEAA